MSRKLLDEKQIDHSIRGQVGGKYNSTIREIIKESQKNKVLIVGMGINPFCKKVRKQLDSNNIAYKYLEYGSYFKDWQLRLSLKMWTGWNTFPMVFVNEILVGGNNEIKILINSGRLKKMLSKSD